MAYLIKIPKKESFISEYCKNTGDCITAEYDDYWEILYRGRKKIIGWEKVKIKAKEARKWIQTNCKGKTIESILSENDKLEEEIEEWEEKNHKTVI